MVFGWIVAVVASGIVKNILKRTTLDNKIAAWIAGRKIKSVNLIENVISKGVYYLIMLFVLVGFFQSLGLTLIAEPLNNFLNQVGAYAPRIIGAGILLLGAWLVASMLKRIVVGVLDGMKIDEKLGKQHAKQDVLLSATIGEVLYWLVFLFFLPAVLDALALQGLLVPVQSMINKGMSFLPNMFGAGLILAVGWFAARIIERISASLLVAVGLDALSEKVGVAKALGKQKLSNLIGRIVYVVVFIPVVIAALEALSLDALTAPASNMLNAILLAIPNIVTAVILMLISYMVGKMAAEWITNILTAGGFDNTLVVLGLGKKPNKDARTLSEIAGSLSLIAVMVFTSIEALNILGMPTISMLVSQFVVFASQLALGIVILALGIYLANLAGKTILDSGTHDAKLLSTVAKSAMLLISGAMALSRMGLANDIINMAFGLMLGSIAVAAALAFGLGGRDIAAKTLEGWAKKV